MLNIVEKTYKDRSGLLVILVVIILALGGAFKLNGDKIQTNLVKIEKGEDERKLITEKIHKLDIKVTELKGKIE